jgi:hypothetical protein
MDACFSQYPSATATYTEVQLRRHHSHEGLGVCRGRDASEQSLTAAEGCEGGGDLRAGGKMEVTAEEHQNEAEPDGRRGHRPVVSDRHRSCAREVRQPRGRGKGESGRKRGWACRRTARSGNRGGEKHGGRAGGRRAMSGSSVGGGWDFKATVAPASMPRLDWPIEPIETLSCKLDKFEKKKSQKTVTNHFVWQLLSRFQNI